MRKVTYDNVVPTMIGHHCIRIFSSQCKKKDVLHYIAQENYLCSVGPERTDMFSWEKQL